MLKRYTFFQVLTSLIFSVSLCHSVPGQVNFQGRLLDTAAQPLTGTFDMIFTIYDAKTGGSMVWTETHSNTPIVNGMFNVVLGSYTALNPNLFVNDNLFLEIQTGTDVLSPRQRFNTVPYSFSAGNSEKLGGYTYTDLLQATTFSGAVNGTYDATTVNNDSHNHTDTTIDDNISIDNGTIYALAGSGNVGIGISTPTAKLDVAGAIAGFGIVPIGSITAWHKSKTGTPALPAGWAECNGQVISDPESPYDGTTVPNLNTQVYSGGRGMYLRGGLTSGTTNSSTSIGDNGTKYHFALDASTYYGCAYLSATDAETGSGPLYGTSRVSRNVQVTAMTVVWIIRIK
ncbi:MAG: hypothetical protein WC955_11060 [Elusimicrobiota bacterium]